MHRLGGLRGFASRRAVLARHGNEGSGAPSQVAAGVDGSGAPVQGTGVPGPTVPVRRTASHEVLVFDGECPLCRRFVGRLHSWRLVSPRDSVALGDLPVEDQGELLSGGMRNELALWDSRARRMRLGADAILRALRKSWLGPLAALLSVPGIRTLVTLGYRFVAYNRRYLSVPKPRPFRCACDPEPQPIYQATLLTLSTILGLSSSALFARAVLGPELGGFIAMTGATALHFLLAASLVLGATRGGNFPADERYAARIHAGVSLTATAWPLLAFGWASGGPWIEGSRGDLALRIAVGLGGLLLLVWRGRRSFLRRGRFLGRLR